MNKASIAAAHAEALEINNAMALQAVADECIARITENELITPVVADWNSCARLAGYDALQMTFNARNWPRNVVVNVFNLRKTILDIKVNP